MLPKLVVSRVGAVENIGRFLSHYAKQKEGGTFTCQKLGVDSARACQDRSEEERKMTRSESGVVGGCESGCVAKRKWQHVSNKGT